MLKQQSICYLNRMESMSKRPRGQSRQLRPDPAADNIRDPQQEQDELEQSGQPSERIGQENPEQFAAEQAVKTRSKQRRR
jgi:hypothetical protein